LNVYEAVDVLALIQDETYENLRLMVKDALYLRSDAVLPVIIKLTNQEFEGVFTCTVDDTLDYLFETIRRARLHRFVIVDDSKKLVGMLTLSDILGYLLYGELGEDGLESKITVPRSQSRV
jgi:5'-AMP-activated protein kinase, regulatory gamma subunit